MKTKTPIPVDLFVDMAITIERFANMFNTNDNRLGKFKLDWAYLHKINRRGKYILMELYSQNLFVVYAENGNENGWGLISAKNKKEARVNAYKEWLSNAKIVKIIPFTEYFKDNKLTANKIEELISKLGEKEYYEMEWGS